MMNAYQQLIGPPGAGGRFYGVVIGIVTDNKDPGGLGRVKASLPWLADDAETDWARVVTPMAGGKRGIYFLPEVNDEVLVAFEHGDPAAPYVLGGLWNGKDEPPESNGNGKNDVRVIRSRNGNVIRLSDAKGDEKIEIIDAAAKNTIVISTKDNSITITADADVTIRSGNGKLTLSGKGVEITSTAAVKIEGSQGMDLKTPARLTIKGATVNIN
jgi:phage baseplate assembly protein V